MRTLFYLYSFLYISISLVIHFADVSLIVAQSLYCASILVMGIVLLAPIAIMISPRLIKSHKSDPRYLNLCFVAGLFRIIFLACGPFGLRDYVTLLYLNAFGLLIYVLFIERHINKLSNEYFKY